MEDHLCQTSQCHIPVRWLWKQLEKNLNHVGLQDIAQGDPRQVDAECLQGCPYEVWLLASRQHKRTELMDESELSIERLLQL